MGISAGVNMFRPFSTGIVLFFALLSVSRAAESVDELVAAALAAEPELRAWQAAGEAAEASRAQAARRPNPEFHSELGFKRVDADGDTENGYVFGVSLEQPWERRGKRTARAAMAGADMQLADANWALAARQLETTVRGWIVQYAIADADGRAADEVSRRSQALIAMLKERPVAGASVFLELRVVEANLIEFQAVVRERTALRDDARIALNALLNRAPEAPVDVAFALGALRPPPPATELTERLLSGPGMRVLQATLARRAGEQQAAILDAKPDVVAGPFYSHEEAGETEATLGLSLSMELPWRNRNQGTIAAASALTAQAEAMLQAEQRRLEGELARAIAAQSRALDELKWVTDERVAQVHDAADLAERQYRLGAIDVQLFLDLQRESLNVQRLRYDALLRAWQSALEILLLTGVKPEVAI